MECHYHADEATPHIHLDFVPVATGYKQGLDVQNGFDKALMQQMGLSQSESKRKLHRWHGMNKNSKHLLKLL